MIANLETALSTLQAQQLAQRAVEIKLLRGVVEAYRGCHIDHPDTQSASDLYAALEKLTAFDQNCFTSPPEDPLDTPLPCDVKIGHMTLRKGVSLRTLVMAATRWHELLLLVDELNSRPLVVMRKDGPPIDLSALSKVFATIDEYLQGPSAIDQPAPAEPIISDTGTSVIQNEPEPESVYRATFSSEGSMAYLAGGGTLETIIVPD